VILLFIIVCIIVLNDCLYTNGPSPSVYTVELMCYEKVLSSVPQHVLLCALSLVEFAQFCVLFITLLGVKSSCH